MCQLGARGVSIHGGKLSPWAGRALLGGLLGTYGFNPQFLQADGYVCMCVYMLVFSVGAMRTDDEQGFCLTCMMIKRLGRIKKCYIRRENELLCQHQHVVL